MDASFGDSSDNVRSERSENDKAKRLTKPRSIALN